MKRAIVSEDLLVDGMVVTIRDEINDTISIRLEGVEAVCYNVGQAVETFSKVVKYWRRTQ